MADGDSGQNGGAPAIELQGVAKAYDRRLVLDGIDLVVPLGQAPCLCGVNGAGKSTLMRVVAGLLQPTRGTVRVCGRDGRADARAVRTLFGVVSHHSMLYHHLTVEENLRFYARLYGVARPQQRAAELATEVGLGAYRHDLAGILSRGMLQRLAIARALVHRPRILLADEPFTGLDLNAIKQLVELLTAFRNNGGTVLMTTHDTAQGLLCCNRVLVLDGRRIVFDAPVDGLDRDRFNRDYLAYARSCA